MHCRQYPEASPSLQPPPYRTHGSKGSHKDESQHRCFLNKHWHRGLKALQHFSAARPARQQTDETAAHAQPTFISLRPGFKTASCPVSPS